ncbi:MAG: hypothetical protein QXS24_04295 [Desulfurococcaceae archaeon]
MMKFTKLILLIMMLANTLPHVNYINPGSERNTILNESSVELIYRGVMTLDITGGGKIREYIDLANTSCSTPIDYVSITIYFKIDMTVDFNAFEISIRLKNTSVIIEDYRVTPSCINLAINSLLNNTHVRNNLGRVPIELTIENNSLVLLEPSISGKVVGIVRFNYDVIYAVDVYSYEDAVTLQYIRYDLYYEPITNIPVHLSIVRAETSTSGSLRYILYVTLFNDPCIFRNIHRKVFDIEYTEFNKNKTATLIVIYYPLNNSGLLPEPTVNSNTDNIALVFKEDTVCFIQLGVLLGNVTSTIQMNRYNTTDGFVYYSAKPEICRIINITISSPTPSVIREQKDYPEKGLPPSFPPETIGDVIVAITVFVPMFILIYWLFKSIINRIIYS